MFMGILASRSRSGLLGAAIGTALIAIMTRIMRIKFVSLSIIALGVIGVTALLVAQRDVLAILEDTRLNANWQAYYPALFKYPMGIPGDLTYDEVLSRLHYGEHGFTPDVIQMLDQISGLGPHNVFMTTAVIYGLGAGCALLLLYFSLASRAIRKYIHAIRSGDIINGTWVAIMLGANCSILFHAWFHSANLVVGDMRNWFWIGALLVHLKHRDCIRRR
jgi:hypothetical protein